MDILGFAYSKIADLIVNIGHVIYNLVPNIIAAIIIIVLGFLIANILKKLTVKILYRTGMGRATRISGFDETLKRVGYQGTTIDLIGIMVKIFVILIAIATAANVMMLKPVVDFFQGFTFFFPRLIVAIIVLIIGTVFADIFSKFVSTALSFARTEKEKNIIIFGIAAGIVSKIMIYLLVAILVLNIIGISLLVLDVMFIVSLVTAAGLVLLGAKTVLPSFIAGIYLQKAYEQGDIIKIKDSTGKIVHLGTLFTQLETVEKRINVPNKILLDEIVEKEIKLIP